MGVHPASYLLPGISAHSSLLERIAAPNNPKRHYAQTVGFKNRYFIMLFQILLPRVYEVEF